MAFSETRADAEMVGTGLFLFAVGIALIFYGLGPTILILQPSRLVARKEVFGIGWNRSFNADELCDLRFWWVAIDGDYKAYTTPGIVLGYRGKTVRFGVSKLYRDEAEYLVSLIKARYPKINVIPPEAGKHNWKE